MQEINYYSFINKLDSNAAKKHIPIRAMFELTHRCNFNCIHCYIPLKERRCDSGELNTKQVFNIIDELCNLGCFTLGFTGGEIFLRKDLLDILRYSKTKGFNVVILTNGFFINDEIAEELKKLALNKVDITLHSMKKKNFEKITDTKGSFEKVMAAIKLLHKKGVPLGLKNCAMKENKNDLADVEKFSQKIGVLARLGAGITPRLDGDKTSCSFSANMPGNGFNNNNNRLSDKIKLPKRKVFSCNAGTKSLTISPKGELKLCLEIDYPKYNILRGSLRQGWKLVNDIAEKSENDKNFKCNACNLRPFCSWCPAMGWLENKSLTACGSLSRNEAENRRNLSLMYSHDS